MNYYWNRNDEVEIEQTSVSYELEPFDLPASAEDDPFDLGLPKFDWSAIDANCEALGWDFNAILEKYGPYSREYHAFAWRNQKNLPVLPDMTPAEIDRMMDWCQ